MVQSTVEEARIGFIFQLFDGPFYGPGCFPAMWIVGNSEVNCTITAGAAPSIPSQNVKQVLWSLGIRKLLNPHVSLAASDALKLTATFTTV